MTGLHHAAFLNSPIGKDGTDAILLASAAVATLYE